MNPLFWNLAYASLVVAFVPTLLGIVWSIVPHHLGGSHPGDRDPTRWDDVRGAAMLGAGLVFTTAAGLFALVGTPRA